MKPHLTVVTLAVSDLERSLVFYRDGLGLATKGIIGTEYEDGAVVFFHLTGGLMLALYPRPSLAKDAKIEIGGPGVSTMSLGHVVETRDDVDQVMRQAIAAGASEVDAARDRFWGGYSGYFRDLDGHLWEIAYNPGLTPG
jgi:catechol 2,3-dioxygenase-like lactoylglutathione lyase family enzyme